MQQHIARKDQVIVEPSLGNEIGEVGADVACKDEGDAKGEGDDGEEQKYLFVMIAVYCAELIEEDDPKDEVDAVVDEHAEDLAQKGGAIFHGRRPVDDDEFTDEKEFGF